MHVVCPACDTRYEIPPIVRPRRLSCARCSHQWRIEPPDAAADPVGVPAGAVAAPAVEPPPVPAAAAGPQAGAMLAGEALSTRSRGTAVAARSGFPWLMAAWVASLLALGVAIWAVWHWHASIALHWPPSRRLFGLFVRHPRG